jgi:hypothetical protein
MAAAPTNSAGTTVVFCFFCKWFMFLFLNFQGD